MGGKEEPISALFIIIVAMGLYGLLQRGIIDMTALGSAIAAVGVAAIAGAIWWGWKGRIEQWLKQQSNPKEQLRSTTEKIDDKTHQKEELEKLIKPLYLSLDSNRDNPIQGANLAFSEIKQYGNLAQPELRNLLRQYCEIREENPNPEDRAPSYHWDHQKGLTDTINQIAVLVRKRYKELMWGEKES